MRLFLSLALISTVALIWTAPASAMSCRDWKRLAGDQKPYAIDQMIDDAIASQRGRSYKVNREAIRRCLYNAARNIEYDFDDTCANSRSTSMQALNDIFKSYIWSCVR